MKTAILPRNLRSLRRGRFVGCVAVAVAALIGSAIASAQAAASAGRSATAMQAVASVQPQAAAAHVRDGQSEAKPDDASHEGIKVHGHWKIDIKNPDGTIVQHREFENAIYTSGTQLLGYLLTGKAVAGEPMVYLSSSGTAPCSETNAFGPFFNNGCHLFSNPNGWWGPSNICSANGGGAYGTCFFNEYSVCANPSACSTSLTTTLIPQPNSAFNIQFAGQIAAMQNGTIDNVSTWFVLCSTYDNNGNETVLDANFPRSPDNPAACYDPGTYGFSGWSYSAFTGTPITPIPVSAGQTIQASVVISFASLQ